MEKNPLLDGSFNSYHSLPGEEKSKEEDIEQNVDNLRPWQRWKRNQVIPAIILLCGSFLGMMSSKSIGPSLLDLQIRTSSSIDQVSWFMSTRALGAMLGALVLGYFIDRPTRWLQICLAACLTGLSFLSIPWFKIFLLELFMFTIYGFFVGYLFSGNLLTVYSLFDNKDDSIAWLNGCQLAYAIGGLFGPLIVQPFLLEVETFISDNNTLSNSNSSALFNPDDVRVMYSFLITGCLLIVISAAGLLIYFVMGNIKVSVKKKEVSDMNIEQELSTKAKVLRISFIILLVAYYIVQSVILRTFNNYIVPFCVNHLGWTKAEGTNLATVYFAASMMGKVAIILFVRFIKLELLLFGGLVLSNIAAIGLSFFITWHGSIIWVFSIMSSLGSCITVSVLLAWTDKNIGIRGSVGVIYSWAGSLGEIAFNPLIGYLFENVSYMSMMYMVLASSIGCLLIMVILQIIGVSYKKLVD